MGTNKIVTLMDGYKEIDSVEVICAFEIPELFGKYIIYTKNEKDNEGNAIIYSGRILIKDNKQYIENILEGNEWEKIKTIMKAMSKYSLEGERYV